jgi:hypothetical protein
MINPAKNDWFPGTRTARFRLSRCQFRGSPENRRRSPLRRFSFRRLPPPARRTRAVVLCGSSIVGRAVRGSQGDAFSLSFTADRAFRALKLYTHHAGRSVPPGERLERLHILAGPGLTETAFVARIFLSRPPAANRGASTFPVRCHCDPLASFKYWFNACAQGCVPSRPRAQAGTMDGGETFMFRSPSKRDLRPCWIWRTPGSG